MNTYFIYSSFQKKKRKKSTINLLCILNLFGLVALNEGKKKKKVKKRVYVRTGMEDLVVLYEDCLTCFFFINEVRGCLEVY